MPFKEAYIQKSSVGFILKKHKDKIMLKLLAGL